VEWLNTEGSLRLENLQGRVVVLHAFQMLCPGCVLHGLPQAQRIHNLFPRDEIAVIGLHTVFEHHEAMTPAALKAFVHEFRLSFPIGIDQPGETSPIPQTMHAYGMRGTPTLILIDRRGIIRKHSFGQEDDLKVGADIASLLCERDT
jgi:hypothetical protein